MIRLSDNARSEGSLSTEALLAKSPVATSSRVNPLPQAYCKPRGRHCTCGSGFTREEAGEPPSQFVVECPGTFKDVAQCQRHFLHITALRSQDDLQRFIALERIAVPRSHLDQQAFGTQRHLQPVQGRRLVIQGQVDRVLVRVTGQQEHLALVAVAAQGRHVVFLVVTRGGEEQGGFQLHGRLGSVVKGASFSFKVRQVKRGGANLGFC